MCLTLVNSGCRCPSIGRAPAAKTRGGQFDGPGPISNLRGKSSGFNKLCGGDETADPCAFVDEENVAIDEAAPRRMMGRGQEIVLMWLIDRRDRPATTWGQHFDLNSELIVFAVVQHSSWKLIHRSRIDKAAKGNRKQWQKLWTDKITLDGEWSTTQTADDYPLDLLNFDFACLKTQNQNKRNKTTELKI